MALEGNRVDASALPRLGVNLASDEEVWCLGPAPVPQCHSCRLPGLGEDAGGCPGAALDGTLSQQPRVESALQGGARAVMVSAPLPPVSTDQASVVRRTGRGGKVALGES